MKTMRYFKVGLTLKRVDSDFEVWVPSNEVDSLNPSTQLVIDYERKEVEHWTSYEVNSHRIPLDTWEDINLRLKELNL